MSHQPNDQPGAEPNFEGLLAGIATTDDEIRAAGAIFDRTTRLRDSRSTQLNKLQDAQRNRVSAAANLIVDQLTSDQIDGPTAYAQAEQLALATHSYQLSHRFESARTLRESLQPGGLILSINTIMLHRLADEAPEGHAFVEPLMRRPSSWHKSPQQQLDPLLRTWIKTDEAVEPITLDPAERHITDPGEIKQVLADEFDDLARSRYNSRNIKVGVGLTQAFTILGEEDLAARSTKRACDDISHFLGDRVDRWAYPTEDLLEYLAKHSSDHLGGAIETRIATFGGGLDSERDTAEFATALREVFVHHPELQQEMPEDTAILLEYGTVFNALEKARDAIRERRTAESAAN